MSGQDKKDGYFYGVDSGYDPEDNAPPAPATVPASLDFFKNTRNRPSLPPTSSMAVETGINATGNRAKTAVGGW